MNPTDPPPPFAELPTRGGLTPGGRVFDRFVLRRVLGRGGMAVVWEARDERLGEEVALKFLPDTLRWDPAALEGLRKETQRARTLAHPHIVRVYDLHEGADGAAIAMERVSGRTLSAWRLEQPGGVVSAAAILQWLPQLCQALDYAHHDAGIVHRDLKPANIMLTHEGRVKVADFGIACVAAESLVRTSTVGSGGTLPYMSPQQLWGETATPADDVYALGVVLFELLVGEPPFVRGHLHAQIERRVPPRVSAARRARLPEAEGVPRVWDETVARCLAKERTGRPGSAADVLRALADNEASTAPTDPGRRRRVAGLALAAAALAVPVGWLHWPSQPEARDTSPSFEGPAATAPTHPGSAARHTSLVPGALGQRLVAHLPLDGDLRVHGGRRAYAAGVAAEWTEDRFGRPRAALQLRGTGAVTLPLDGELRGDGSASWTLACWVRSETPDGGIAMLTPYRGGEAHLGLSVGRFMPQATTGPHTADVTYAYDRRPLEGRWHHLAVTLDPGKLTLWRDGREVGAESIGAAAPTAESFRLEVGTVPGSWVGRWRGAIDDLRVYSAALGAEAIASLAAEDAPPAEKWIVTDRWIYPWRRSDGRALTLTVGSHSDAEDDVAAVRREFGPEARVADWADLAVAAGPWPELLLESLGWVQGDAMYLRRGGSRVFDVVSPRPYYAIRTAGIVSTTFLQHARLGADELSLGSWAGQTLPIVAEAPAARIFRMTRWEDGRLAPPGWQTGPGELRITTAPEGNRRGWIAVASLPELGRLPDGALWELADDRGGVWRVAWAPTVPGVWGLEIARTAGSGDVVARARHEEATGMQALELVVVVTRGRGYAAVVDPAVPRWIGSTASKDVTFDPRRAWTATLRTPGSAAPPAMKLEWVEFPGENP